MSNSTPQTQTQTQTQTQNETTQQPQQQKPAVLEEDDEFEDFPVEDWPQEETEQAAGSTAATNGGNVHLWEESWDDDDANEDFSKQLKEEIKKVEAASK